VKVENLDLILYTKYNAMFMTLFLAHEIKTALSTNYNFDIILMEKIIIEKMVKNIFNTHSSLRCKQNCCFPGSLSLHLS